MIRIIDTFRDFEKCFKDNLNISLEEKISLWEEEYISKYPELEKKCKEDYENSGYKWRKIAVDMVFNRTKDDFSKMLEAYNNILLLLTDINERVKKVFGVNLDINIVLYAGLCNSAGWVDYYNGKRAILFGIDKIAELSWHTMDKLKTLISHELCHVIHFDLRGEDNLPSSVENNNYNRGIWRIYEEGFAQFYQQKLLNDEVDCRGNEWIEECNSNKEQLKTLYLSALLDESNRIKEFFGDWFKVLGISDTGYFLGAELIKELNSRYSVEYIACLSFSRITEEVLTFLKKK